MFRKTSLCVVQKGRIAPPPIESAHREWAQGLRLRLRLSVGLPWLPRKEKAAGSARARARAGLAFWRFVTSAVPTLACFPFPFSTEAHDPSHPTPTTPPTIVRAGRRCDMACKSLSLLPAVQLVAFASRDERDSSPSGRPSPPSRPAIFHHEPSPVRSGAP